MIHVRVLFFAIARDLVGSSQIEVDLPDDSTLADLRGILVAKYPALEPTLSRCLFSINEAYATANSLIPANAEIACIPPVSGG